MIESARPDILSCFLPVLCSSVLICLLSFAHLIFQITRIAQVSDQSLAGSAMADWMNIFRRSVELHRHMFELDFQLSALAC
jgi:hypothetical protein